MEEYIHGYSDKEQERLIYQNQVLSRFIYDNLDIGNDMKILEIGCGVGAQMMYLLDKYPTLHIHGLDISQEQIDQAKINLANTTGYNDRYALYCGSISTLDIDWSSYDGVLFVWVLEHMNDPIMELKSLNKKLHSGTKLWLTEVNHSRLYFHPKTPAIAKLWQISIDFQAEIGGDANIGVQCGNMLYDAGFTSIEVAPYNMFFDKTQNENRRIMFEYWEGLMESAVHTLIEKKIIEESLWEQAKVELKQIQQDDNAVFCYSFIQGKASV